MPRPLAARAARRRAVQLGPDRWVSRQRVWQLLCRIQSRVVAACVDLAIEIETPSRPRDREARL